MRLIGSFKKLLLLSSTLALLATMFVSTLAMADQVDGQSYFENAVIDIPNLIPANHAGSNSVTGSVLPNWDPSKVTSNGAGAVGTKALGINGSTPNRARKQAMYDFLKNKYNNGIDWEKMGTALIAHQMLGKAWGAGSRTVTNAEWTDLYNRLVENDDLIMNRAYYNHNKNSAGVIVNGKYDAVKWQYFDDIYVDAWVFTVNGSTVYSMELICANPLGDLDGLPDNPPPPPADYNLVPSANSNNVSMVEPGGQIKVDGMVRNTKNNPSTGNEWQLTQVVYKPGATPGPNGGDNASDPCSFFFAAGRIPPPCVKVDGGSRVFPAATNTIVKNDFVYNVPETAEVGTNICFAVSVKPPDEDPANVNIWRHSNLDCVIVGKSPKMQVWGGDVRTGGKIDTSKRTFTTPALTFGSWGEYGVLSKGDNSGFGSGSGLNNGNASASQSSWSNLTFANTGTDPSCDFGCYNFTLSSAGLAGQFALPASPQTITGTQDINSLASGTYRGTPGTLHLSGTTIDRGKTIIIISTGNVRIDGDISYKDGPYSNIRDIPQVIIKAPIIRINPAAKRVDSWLIATKADGSGELNTCWDTDITNTTNLSANICNSPLVINGPVVADSVYLRRTAGSESDPNKRGNPAEIFNLRADAYLWANAYGSGSSRVQTVYTKELSPRF